MANVVREQRHTRNSPCPICGGYDEAPRGEGRRCGGYTSPDGLYTRCSREELAGALAPDDYGLYRHRNRDLCHCGSRHGPNSPRKAKAEPEATYDYVDEAGDLIFRVVRFPGKQFRQCVPDGAGGWIWKISGARRVLYRLPELIGSEDPVYVVEGEKDVDTLRKLGLTATTTSGGAGKWRMSDVSPLLGRRVIVIADADDVGRQHAKTLGAYVSASQILESPIAKDITDHLAAGGTIASLVPMAEPAPPSNKAPIRLLKPPKDDGPPPEPDGRPEIVLGKDLHRVLAELDEHLGATDPLLFQRDHELVAIVGSRAKEGKARLVAGTPVIRSLTAPALLPRVTEYVKCLSVKQPTKAQLRNDPDAKPTLVEAWPTPSVTSGFLGALDWLHVRQLTGITECPTLRPDGTVVQDAGYDEATGYLYLPSCEYPRVPDQPTHSEAVLAYARLAEVFCDFPYVDGSHRSAVVAAILSLVCRPAILGSVPCFLFDANSRRSGKTLQVDVISLIVSGRVASRMTFPDSEEELEKVLSGYALAGARMVNFDNVERPFGGQALDKCITAIDTVDLRVLGGSTIRTLTWRSVLFASGNNVRGKGDVLERVLSPRLVSPLEHPERRDLAALRHPDLRAWVAGMRAELVVAALTLVRAYCAAGRPPQPIPPWGGFEGFRDLIASALVWVGAQDPMDARRGGERDDDPTRRAERSLVAGWAQLCAHLSVTSLSVSAAIRAIYPAPGRDDPPDSFDDLRESIAELTSARPGSPPDPKRLGEAIRRMLDKPTDGLVFRPDGTTDGSRRWSAKPG